MKTHKPHAQRVNYGIEIFILLMSLSGVYLIISDLDLAGVARKALLLASESFIEYRRVITVNLLDMTARIRLSDMVGVILLGITAILALIRFRDRLVRSKEMLEYCPQCGTHMARQHRTAGQRLLTFGLGLNSASYRCLDCNFKHSVFRYKITSK